MSNIFILILWSCTGILSIITGFLLKNYKLLILEYCLCWGVLIIELISKVIN